MQTHIPYDDTITAVATPVGRGGIGIIRISGPAVLSIAEKIANKKPKPRYALHSIFVDANDAPLDEGLILYFPKPHSFTGEDVLELQCHGSAIILDAILKRIISLGARLARPGEFSERAFLNGKIDLTQAEAIADLVDSASIQAAKSALRSLQGEFSKHIYSLINKIIALRVQIEAWIDFPEEEINIQIQKEQINSIAQILLTLDNIEKTAHQGILLREGIRIVLIGKPNAGKSSLLNYLSGEETAIVTPIPGTTRDILQVPLQIDGLPLNIIDTAGLQNTIDVVEQEGIRRARNEITKADHILCFVDANETKERSPNLILDGLEVSKEKLSDITIVFNKIDLSDEKEKITSEEGVSCVYLSAKTGQGISILREHLKKIAGFQAIGEYTGTFSARRRHLEALQLAKEHLIIADKYLQTHHALELIAEELRQAQRFLGQITGEFSTDDLLNKIFSTFCIGK